MDCRSREVREGPGRHRLPTQRPICGRAWSSLQCRISRNPWSASRQSTSSTESPCGESSGRPCRPSPRIALM
uniref:Gp250 n=1 Tax=uncultured marine virus TaxID=186617 RepID=A0A0F7L9X5_9VIRU|nr:gp250 [uncultured marine virus]